MPPPDDIPAGPAATAAMVPWLLEERDRLAERCTRLEVTLRDDCFGIVTKDWKSP